MAARCCWPEDSWWGCFPACSGMPTLLRDLHGPLPCLPGAFLQDPQGGEGDVVQYGHMGEQAEVLGDHADVPAHGVDIAGITVADIAVEDIAVDEHVAYDDIALLVFLQLVEGAEEGGLAGPGGAGGSPRSLPGGFSL